MRARIEAENEFEQMHFTIPIYLVKYIELMHQFVFADNASSAGWGCDPGWQLTSCAGPCEIRREWCLLAAETWR
jgi:hypothetical protein